MEMAWIYTVPHISATQLRKIFLRTGIIRLLDQCFYHMLHVLSEWNRECGAEDIG